VDDVVAQESLSVVMPPYKSVCEDSGVSKLTIVVLKFMFEEPEGSRP